MRSWCKLKVKHYAKRDEIHKDIEYKHCKGVAGNTPTKKDLSPFWEEILSLFPTQYCTILSPPAASCWKYLKEGGVNIRLY